MAIPPMTTSTHAPSSDHLNASSPNPMDRNRTKITFTRVTGTAMLTLPRRMLS